MNPLWKLVVFVIFSSILSAAHTSIEGLIKSIK